MRELNDFKQVNENENYQEWVDALQNVEKALPELSKLIKKHIGVSPKLLVRFNKGRSSNNLKIYGEENLIKELGNGLVKTIFTEISIDMWGGTMTKDNMIWFNPKISYQHPGGGSNGTDFIWNGLWFDLANNKWIEGTKIF